MRKNIAQRMLSAALSVVMAVSSLSIAYAANDDIATYGTVYHANQKLQKQSSQRIPFLKFNGVVDYDNFVPMQVAWTNPATKDVYQAYCINPAYPGYGDVADYGVDIEKFDNDCIVDAGGSGGSGKTAGSKSAAGNTIAAFLEGAVNYGYPSVEAATLLGGTAESYGVTQEQLNYAAYLATKMAIWSGIHSNYGINSWGVNDGLTGYSATLKTNVLKATKSIYNKAGSYTPSDGKSTVTFTTGEHKKAGGNYEVTYTIGNTGNNVEGSDMYVEMAAGGAFTNGIVIQSADGKTLNKTTTSSGTERYIVPAGTTEVKALLPDPGEKGVTAELRLYAKQKKKILLYGRSTKSATQGYVLAGNHYDNPTAKFEINPEPDTPDGGSGKLTVIKLDARDNATPLAGVTFDCYNSNGQLVDTGTTDKSGKWIPKISKAGTYTVIERSTNNKYQLTEPTTLVITVPTDNDVTATFRDYPSQTVTIEKEDAVTGNPVPGCEYEIIQIDGKGVWRATGKTDANGKITWDDVPDGTYLVREVSTTDGYILDQTPQYVTVRNGQAPSLKFLDSKHPGLTISKVDKQTGEVIPSPAVFRVAQTDGSYKTDITTANGTATLTDLPVGSYRVSEVQAPEGYVKDDCPQDIYLGKGESKQLTIFNSKKPVLTIEKIDGKTGNTIAGTKFELKKSDGTVIGTVTTGADGKVTVGMQGSELGYLDPDTYTVTEVFVPEPYVLSSEHKDIKLEAGDNKTLLFANLEMPTITVEKYDEKTGEKLEGAQFGIYEQDDLARPVAEGMTDADGRFTSGKVKPGTYVVKEINPPKGYMFSDKTKPDRVIVAKAGDGEIIVKVDNIKLPELTIKKIDSVTKEPISGVTYEIKMVDDTSVQPATAVTDENGLITVPNLVAGTYEVTEISTPKPYILNSTPQEVKLEGGDTKTLLFENTKYPTLIVQKTDGTTNKGIPNTTYLITHEKADGSAEIVGTFKTDENGRIKLPYVEPGWYVITETIPAQGYQKPTNPITRIYLKPGDNSYTTNNAVTGDGEKDENGNKDENTGNNTKNPTITSGADYEKVGEIINYPLNSIVIKKSDANTGEMLEGATFEVIKTTGETSGQNGTVICTVTTDHSGVIVITGLEAGAYAVREVKAPQNYLIDETNLQTVNLKADGTSVVEVTFRNYPYGSIQINKVDGTTKKPLEGAEFKVTDAAGNLVGNYKTDANGSILIPNLKPDSYVVTETKAPDGYALKTEPQTVTVGTDGKIKTVTFTNEKKLGVQIIKIDSETRQPLQGAEFQIWNTGASSSTSVAAGTPAGVLVGTYTTDINGVINVVLDAGTYEILETKAPKGYQLDKHKQDIVVKDGEQTSVTFTNTKLPDGTILIHKTDAKTGDAIEGVTFEIRKENGELIATEETDKQGEITVSGLEKGTYYVKETKAKEGYKADDKSHKVVLGKSGYVKLEVENTPLSGLRLKKIDSITGEGIYGVEFALYNKNGKIVGNYFTDNKGVIDFDAELPEGRYTIKEITPADGYYSDNKPRTVELRAGKVTQITWENTPQAGQIKIKKVSGDYNETNALPKGTALQGAIFEIYNYKTHNVVDRIETDYYGIANSKPLPLGRYIIKEVQAPSYYKINPEEIDVTIEFATQVLNLTVEDYSANMSVGIDKFGPYEVMQGQPAVYTIKNVRNSSTVPLNDFYWRDIIPTSAGTLDKIITGTYNMQGRYKVVATTSAGNTKVLADNMDTAKNNVILCSPAAVGLRSGEYITSVSLMFGTVQPGFTQVLDAKVYLNVKKSGLPSNYQFANKVDIGGKYGNEWATGNSTWVTTIYNPAKQKLPKTGW